MTITARRWVRGDDNGGPTHINNSYQHAIEADMTPMYELRQLGAALCDLHSRHAYPLAGAFLLFFGLRRVGQFPSLSLSQCGVRGDTLF